MRAERPSAVAGSRQSNWTTPSSISEPQADALAALDDALQRLEAIDPRQGQIVEHRYFAGLSLEETAESVGVSLATVKRELRFAHAWLAAELRVSGTADNTGGV